jgi:hypothetical protein
MICGALANNLPGRTATRRRARLWHIARMPDDVGRERDPAAKEQPGVRLVLLAEGPMLASPRPRSCSEAREIAWPACGRRAAHDPRDEAGAVDADARLTGRSSAAHSPDACADAPFRVFDIHGEKKSPDASIACSPVSCIELPTLRWQTPARALRLQVT